MDPSPRVLLLPDQAGTRNLSLSLGDGGKKEEEEEKNEYHYADDAHAVVVDFVNSFC